MASCRVAPPAAGASSQVLPLPSPGRTYISNIAEVTVRAIQPGDAFVIVACDGLWDELSNHEVRNSVLALACLALVNGWPRPRFRCAKSTLRAA